MIINGILEKKYVSNFNHFRFVDLKATPGRAASNKRDLIDYIIENKNEILQFFVSNDPSFGLRPKLMVMLGNSAYDLFNKYFQSSVAKLNPNLQWVRMPHPSAQTVANDLLKVACREIKNHLEPINKTLNKWFCRGRSKTRWINA